MIVKDCNIEAGTAVVDITGLVVIDENTILRGAFETMDEVVVVTNMNKVVYRHTVGLNKALGCALKSDLAI